MDQFTVGSAASSNTMKQAFNAKKVGWYIYMIGEGGNYAAFGKGGKADTKLLKEFTLSAKQQKGKVFRGTVRKVGGDANPFCVIQPAGTPPPMAKFFSDLKITANKAGVANLLPKSAAELLFNPKIHNAPDEIEEEEEEEQEPPSSASDHANAPPPTPNAPDDAPERRARLKDKAKEALTLATADYDDVMGQIARMDDISAAAEADLTLFSEVFAQIEKTAAPAAVDKVKAARIVDYEKRLDALMQELDESKRFVQRQGWFLGNAPRPNLSSQDKQENEQLFKRLKQINKDVEVRYEALFVKIMDDITLESVAAALYTQFARVETVLAPATKTLKLNAQDRQRYDQRVQRELAAFERAFQEARRASVNVNPANSDNGKDNGGDDPNHPSDAPPTTT